jgi:hypothetical protein
VVLSYPDDDESKHVAITIVKSSYRLQRTFELRHTDNLGYEQKFYVIQVSALLYIINFVNCYQNGPQKARK